MDLVKEDVVACSVVELENAQRFIVNYGGEEIVLFWNKGEIKVLNNTCVHKKRKLSEGFILQDRIVCPGHQWAFNLDSGYCRERDRTQQIYKSRIENNQIIVEFIKSELSNSLNHDKSN